MKSRKTKKTATNRRRTARATTARWKHTQKLQTATLLTPLSEKQSGKRRKNHKNKRNFFGANHRSFKREATQHLATELRFQLGVIRATSRRRSRDERASEGEAEEEERRRRRVCLYYTPWRKGRDPTLVPTNQYHFDYGYIANHS
jgi:hypothetical protein